MTVSEMTQVLQEAELNGEQENPTDLLIAKLVECAAKSRCSVLMLNVATDKRFCDAERELCTTAVFERAQRLQGEKTGAKVKQAQKLEIVKEADGKFFLVPKAGGRKHGPFATRKEATKKREGLVDGAKVDLDSVQASQAVASVDGEHVEKCAAPDSETPAHQNLFRMKDTETGKDGWWFCAIAGSMKNESFGPYDTKQEANEARVSYKKNSVQACLKAGVPICTDAPKQSKIGKVGKAMLAHVSQPVSIEINQPSEPSAADAEADNTAPQDTDSEDTTVKTKTKKAAANGKPKAVKAAKVSKPKSEGKMSALDAAAEVLKGRTKPMSAKEIVELVVERGLWKSPGGATPDATLSAAIGREIAGKGKDSRFAKPEPGRFLHT